MYSKEIKLIYQRDTCMLKFVTALFTIAKTWNQPKCLSTYIHKEYYSDIKKNKVLPFVTKWLELKDIMLSEMRQTQKDKHHRLSFACGN
jgi:hypothetical protein